MSATRFATREKTSIEIYGQNSLISATLKNLSSTGALLEAKDATARLQEGDLICVTIYLSQLKKSHRISAEVIWHQSGKTGVNFLNSEELVEKFMDRASKGLPGL